MKEEVASPNEILEIAVGYQKSQTLFSLVELEIPKILREKPLNSADVARRVKIHPLAMEKFLNACVGIGLLHRENDLFFNTELSEKFLVKGEKFYLGGQMRRYQKRSYPQWENLTEHLKNWKYGETVKENPDAEDQGAEAMSEQHNLALLHGYALAETFDFTKYQTLLDVGGGTGAMSIALCEKYPHLSAIVFDLPKNVRNAKKFVLQSGLKDRIELIGGDIIKDELPENFDVALLANLLAVFDAETNQRLFKRIYDKLPAGGACLISGWILDESRLSPKISALFCLEDICWHAPDVERNFSVYRDWLEGAGFREIIEKTYLEPTKLINSIKQGFLIKN